MTSIRKSLAARPLLSLRSITQQEYGLRTPISLKNFVNPEQKIYRVDDLQSESDVSGWIQLVILSNGGWVFEGSLHNDAWLVGDEYNIGMWAGPISGGTVLYSQQSDRIGAGGDAYFQQKGISSLLALNWNDLKTRGFPMGWHMHTDPSFNWKSFLEVTLGGLAVVASVLPFFGGKSSDKPENPKVTTNASGESTFSGQY